MFPEYRELITELKQNDAHFTRLFDEHNALDEEITKLESDKLASSLHDQIESKKKEKLHLKDQLYQLLKKADTK